MSKLLLYNDAGLCKINSSTGGVGWGGDGGGQSDLTPCFLF